VCNDDRGERFFTKLAVILRWLVACGLPPKGSERCFKKRGIVSAYPDEGRSRTRI